MAGHLELLTYSQVSLARGRNLDTITGGQTVEGFLPFKSDLEITSYALYAIELVEQFTAEHIENYPLFELLLETLRRLSQENNHELTLRFFEIHLLDLVGYRPQLRQCVACHQPLKPVTNYFSPLAGGVLCPNCQPSQFPTYPLSLNALKVLRWLQGNHWSNASRLKLTPALSRELELVIRDYLKYLLERDVKSTAWLDKLKG